MVYAVNILLGPWFVARVLSPQPLAAVKAGGVWLQLEGSWQFVPQSETWVVGCVR